MQNAVYQRKRTNSVDIFKKIESPDLAINKWVHSKVSRSTKKQKPLNIKGFASGYAIVRL